MRTRKKKKYARMGKEIKKTDKFVYQWKNRKLNRALGIFVKNYLLMDTRCNETKCPTVVDLAMVVPFTLISFVIFENVTWIYISWWLFLAIRAPPARDERKRLYLVQILCVRIVLSIYAPIDPFLLINAISMKILTLLYVITIMLSFHEKLIICLNSKVTKHVTITYANLTTTYEWIFTIVSFFIF